MRFSTLSNYPGLPLWFRVEVPAGWTVYGTIAAAPQTGQSTVPLPRPRRLDSRRYHCRCFGLRDLNAFSPGTRIALHSKLEVI